jgi:hypothetical protein
LVEIAEIDIFLQMQRVINVFPLPCLAQHLHLKVFRLALWEVHVPLNELQAKAAAKADTFLLRTGFY